MLEYIILHICCYRVIFVIFHDSATLKTFLRRHLGFHFYQLSTNDVKWDHCCFNRSSMKYEISDPDIRFCIVDRFEEYTIIELTKYIKEIRMIWLALGAENCKTIRRISGKNDIHAAGRSPNFQFQFAGS